MENDLSPLLRAIGGRWRQSVGTKKKHQSLQMMYLSANCNFTFVVFLKLISLFLCLTISLNPLHTYSPLFIDFHIEIKVFMSPFTPSQQRNNLTSERYLEANLDHL